nr:hypothetical protein [Tanacetum cinerariifolium]
MCTRSSSNLPGESSPNLTSSNPKRHNRRRSNQPFILKESPVDTITDQRTMAELLPTPTEGYTKEIVVPPILAEQFELKHSLINMMTSDQFFRLEKDNPHDHIRLFNKITSTIKYKDDRYKDLLRACPHHGFTEFHQLETFYNALNPADQDSLNSAAGGNLLERRTQDVLMIIENKSEVHNSRNKSIVSQVKSSDGNSSSSSEIAKLTHVVNQQTSAVTTSMTAILKEFEAIPPPASEKSDNIQGYVSAAAVNYNRSNSSYRPTGVANQIRSPGFSQPNVQNNQNRFSQPQGYNRGNNFNQDSSYQAPIQQNQVVPLRPLPSNTIANPKGELKSITTRSGLVLDRTFVPMPPSFINLGEDERIEETLMDLELALLSNKEKLLELVNTPLNENCSAVILKKLPEKLRDPGKFLIPCGFIKIKCKSLANLGANINLMPLLMELQGMSLFWLESLHSPLILSLLIMRTILESPLILRRPFLRTAQALIDVHGEEMILRDGDERLTLNMRHDTSSYSNQPQKESINMINIYDNLCKDYLKDLFATNHLSGNPTFSSHTDLTSPEVINPLSGSTTSSSPDHLLEEFVDELALITFPLGNDDLPFDIESDLREIEYLLNHDPTKEMDSILKDSIDMCNLAYPNDNLIDTILEMFTDEHAFDYSYPPLYDEYEDDLFELESSVFLPSLKYYSFLFEDFFEVDALPLTNNEDKVFNLGILIHKNLSEDTVQVTPDKNVKKIAISSASLILEDFEPLLYELPFHKEVPWSKTLLSYSFENEEKVFKPRIVTSKGVHTSLLLKLSHQGHKSFKVIKILESQMEIFSCSYGENIYILDVLCLYFYPP